MWYNMLLLLLLFLLSISIRGNSQRHGPSLRMCLCRWFIFYNAIKVHSTRIPVSTGLYLKEHTREASIYVNELATEAVSIRNAKLFKAKFHTL